MTSAKMCIVTGKTYKMRGTSYVVLALIWFTWSSDQLCKGQYVGSTFKENFKPRFRLHKRDVITGKDKCDMVKNFLTKCTMVTKLKTLKFNWLNKL